MAVTLAIFLVVVSTTGTQLLITDCQSVQESDFQHCTTCSIKVISCVSLLCLELCQSAVPALSDFLQVAQTWDRAPLSGVFSTVFAVIIVENRHLLQKV